MATHTRSAHAGILNYKYDGEAAVRASGLPYAVIRPTGLIGEDKDDGHALLEASQGGHCGCGELGAVCGTGHQVWAIGGFTTKTNKSCAWIVVSSHTTAHLQGT